MGSGNGNGHNGNSSDVIKSATEQLLLYIGSGERHFADNQFGFICDVLRSNGNHGKQIRYVENALNTYNPEGIGPQAEEIRRLAESYAARLPNPSDNARRPKAAGLELRLA